MNLIISHQDMIHIADTKVARRYGDFFIRQIHKFEEVCAEQLTSLLLCCMYQSLIAMYFYLM